MGDNRSIRAPNQDPNSIYFIHPSDASSTQLVSIKFNGNGFNNWKRAMILTLSAKNKLGFVDGSITKPDPISNEFKAWERCNDLVCSWLIFNLDDVIAKSVLFLKTAREIWIDLEERFGYTSMTQVYSLEQQLSELSQGNDNISEFFTKIKTLWDGISDANPPPQCTCQKCTCNLEQRVSQMQQDQRMLQFMMKLNDGFSTIRGNILMQHPMPNVTNAYRLFAQEERHKELSQPTSQSESAAFYADKSRFNDSGRYKSNSNSKFAGNPGKRSQYYCTNCKISGHSIERCFKIHGYPQGFKGSKDRKIAAVSSQSGGDASTDANTSISVDQYNKLMEMLNKQHLHESSNEKSSAHALLAGPFGEEAANSSW